VLQANKGVPRDRRKVPYFDRLNEVQRHEFEQVFDEDYWVAAKINNKKGSPYRLYYSPKTIVNATGDEDDHEYGRPRMRLLVTYPEEHTKLLRGIYDDEKRGLGIGIQQFYYQVCMRYLGITRQECEEFLTSQGGYQLTRGQHMRGLNRPASAKVPNERWEIDCTDVIKYGVNPKVNNEDSEYNIHEHNDMYKKHDKGKKVAGRSYTSILVAVDVFSGYCWAEPLHQKNSYYIAEAFKQIISEARTYPRIVQCDGGSEFQGNFATLVFQLNAHGYPGCEKHKCSILNTIPHSPTSNAMVERMNQEIRGRLREGFVRHNDLEWVKYLQDYVYNINHQKHSRNNYTPALLWTPGYHPPPKDKNFEPRAELETHEDNAPISRIQEALQAKNTRVITRQADEIPTHVFRKGDVVRIALSAYMPEVRARAKADLENKYNAIRWSANLYQVIGSRPPLFVNQDQIHAKLDHAPLVFYKRVGNKLRKFTDKKRESTKEKQIGDIQDFGIRLYDVTRPLYGLQELVTGDVLSKWYPGEDLLYCGDINHLPVPAAVRTDTRSLQLNRMKGYAYSGAKRDE
jgi:hypothetical protein